MDCNSAMYHNSYLVEAYRDIANNTVGVTCWKYKIYPNSSFGRKLWKETLAGRICWKTGFLCFYGFNKVKVWVKPLCCVEKNSPQGVSLDTQEIPTGGVWRLPQDFPQAKLQPMASGLPLETLQTPPYENFEYPWKPPTFFHLTLFHIFLKDFIEFPPQKSFLVI